MTTKLKGLGRRRFYALIWKDFVVHKRHFIWTSLEITVPLLVCALAILSNSHQGRPKLEHERTFDPEDFDRIYTDLNPGRHKILVAPNSSFTRALVSQIDDNLVTVELCNSEQELEEQIRKEVPVSLNQIKKLIPDDKNNVTLAGVVVQSDEQLLNAALASKQPPTRTTKQQKQDLVANQEPSSSYYDAISELDGQPMRIPLNFDISIRATTFRLGPEPFPKKHSLGPFLHSQHYATTYFMASQIMLSRAYMNLLSKHVNNTTSSSSPSPAVIPNNENIIGQRMPYPKFVAHRRLKETTLGTFVAGSQKQKPFVLTMDYCITVGFLVMAIFLAKRIVDERKSRVRDMLRLVGISDWTYYGSHMSNTILITTVQSLMITLLFTAHSEAPSQNTEPSLLFVILMLYCSSAIMFVLALSTLFNSSTKAIIFTSLLWLGLPEVLDRVFKLNAGVVESNGFIPIDESYHLLFCLIPNFGLRLANRLLTECDIYGEFYNKKQLYGEYRAIWANIFTKLPLYKQITLGQVMLALALSVPLYAGFIYLMNNVFSSRASGLSDLNSSGGAASSAGFKSMSGLFSWLVRFVISLIVTPTKLVYQLFFSQNQNKPIKKKKKQEATVEDLVRGDSQWRNNKNTVPDVAIMEPGGKHSGYLNPSFTQSRNQSQLELNSSDQQQQHNNHSKQPVSLELDKLPRDNNTVVEEQASEAAGNSRYFETAPRMLTAGLSIRNLCKTYYTGSSRVRCIDAVKNVSMDMYYSQILGHNGAGKTTLIDIISGHNQKTSGLVQINGYDIDKQPSEARSQVGFCPQFDILFERLTVEEHLYFYGLVKGAGKELKAESEQLLKQSGLDSHRCKLSKNLSGGYKRKLSLAIAMIAGSKVLILDEPTSGMDPESRRRVWDFLQVIRHDRLILMTTHHMEEADALGDRVAVMMGGQVKCAGSPLFLKRVFDAGYHLRISKSLNWNQKKFDELVSSKFKLHDKMENMTPHELMCKFEAHETSTVLPALFDELERLKEQVGIFGFGMTVSTLDDVFMKIGLHFNDPEAQELQYKIEQSVSNQIKSSQQASSGTGGQNSKSQVSGSLYHNERLSGYDLSRQQLRALLTKRFQHAKKNWFQLFWILSISLACIAAIVIMIDFVVFKEEVSPNWSREMTLTGAGYGTKTKPIYQFTQPDPEPEQTEPPTSSLDTSIPSSPSAITTTSGKPPVDTGTTSPAPTTSGPLTSSDSASSASATTNSASASSTGPVEMVADTSTAASLVNDGTLATSEPLQRRRRRRQAPAALNASAQFLNQYWLSEAGRSGAATKELLTYTDINSQMIDRLTSEFADFREHYIVGGEKAGNKYVAWFNGEATHSFPISMNIMLNSILKQFTDLIPDDTHPFKKSQISLKHVVLGQINTLIAFLPQLGRLINLVFLPFSLAFITSYFVIFPTHERVTKSKHLQLMTGVSARIFWLSHFLFDLILYSAYTILVLSIYYIWDRVLTTHKIYFANIEHSVALIALVSLYIFGALPLAYIFSFIAKKPTSAFSSFCVLTILTGTATLTLVSLYELKYEASASLALKTVFTVFLWIARLIPSVSLLVGLQKLFALNTARSLCTNISPEVLELVCRFVNSPLVDDELRVLRPERCCKQVCNDECYDQWPFIWTGWFGINSELAMLVFDACLYWMILVAIESRGVRSSLWRWLEMMQPFGFVRTLLKKARGHRWQVPHFVATKQPNNKSKLEEQAGGGANSIRIEQSGQVEPKTHSLVVSELSKIYSSSKLRAVDQLSFNVDRSEFFGLLGVNGAGKSTTFKMLTGELEPTEGSAWIGLDEVKTGRREYLSKIGYCPQQDALIDSLTGAEMLSLFARLRGIPEPAIQTTVEETLETLGLSRIGFINCENYSGGNKRRLSVGIALIGSPEVVFLDEPTSGVDPRSRRRLWATLADFQQQTKSAIVMTSHSMNECECLCDRVAIMVGGQFKVLGSIQYLRTTLSRGFSLLLKLKPDTLGHMTDLTKSSKQVDDYLKLAFSSCDIQLKDLHQTVIQYHIEPSSELSWSKMLVLLEKTKQELNLEDYQITSDTSLESIFLSLSKEQRNK